MFYDRLLERIRYIKNLSEGDGKESILNIENALERSKLFLFNADQANVFIGTPYPLVNYPHFAFPDVFINFTSPIEVEWPDVKILDHSEWEMRRESSRIRRYHGVSIHQTVVNRLQLKRPVNLDDIVESRGFIDPEEASLKTLSGCASLWYEVLDKLGSLDFANVDFSPESFPDIENKELRRLDNSSGSIEKLHKLTVSLLYFLSCENIDFEYHDPKSTREFKEFTRSIGQTSKHPFYTIKFKRGGGRITPADTGKGIRHGYIYDVRGHFRHLRDERYRRNPDGTYKVIWVPDHQRGLANEIYIPALRDTTKLPTVYQ